MSDLFKDRLNRYEKGLLEGEELKAFEQELEKLEQYQDHLERGNSEQPPETTQAKTNKVLRWSKWKARLQTAFTALGIILLFIIVSTVLTTVYYSWGKPDRIEVFRNVIDQTVTVTEPYGYLGGTSSNVDFLFRMNATSDIRKKVGNENITVGEMKVPFLFSLMGFPERNMYGTESQNQPAFTYQEVGDRGMSDWDRLRHLPEGTVVSAYVSFNEIVNTKAVFDQFSGKNFDILWLAVDTGIEGKDEGFGGVILDPLGFPSFPIWHEDDMVQQSYEEEGSFFNKTVSESYSSPSYEVGDTEVLHEQFVKTLRFLQEHEKMAEKLYTGMNLDLDERIGYLEKNGFNHYGIVITGPTKEILKLENEPLINTIEVDEVGFWNW
ncbi:anti-sigma factor [Virgibacillus sp. W0181]|uniref:anti-sigma factor n=1 Tax=Virgibacillus sp. W0181 TaxID=3391581 RepID=UPI003F48B436